VVDAEVAEVAGGEADVVEEGVEGEDAADAEAEEAVEEEEAAAAAGAGGEVAVVGRKEVPRKSLSNHIALLAFTLPRERRRIPLLPKTWILDNQSTVRSVLLSKMKNWGRLNTEFGTPSAPSWRLLFSEELERFTSSQDQSSSTLVPLLALQFHIVPTLLARRAQFTRLNSPIVQGVIL